MAVIDTTRPHLLATLHDELVAAGVRLDGNPSGGFPGEPDRVILAVQDEDEATARAVLAAHNKVAAVAAWQAARQAERDDDAARGTLLQEINQALGAWPPANQAALAQAVNLCLRALRVILRLLLRHG